MPLGPSHCRRALCGAGGQPQALAARAAAAGSAADGHGHWCGTPCSSACVPLCIQTSAQSAQHNVANITYHRLTIRINAANLGRSGARNALLDGSGAECCVFFDDDVEPTPGCIDAYVRAFVANPTARCFAGPTYMPQAPRLLPMAFRMSGAIEFWETPGEWGGEAVPWAITANVAYKHSDVRFRFPKKGAYCRAYLYMKLLHP